MNNGGPAYPVSTIQYIKGEIATGMSLRDYFAAAALTGYLAWSPPSDERLPSPDSTAEYVYSIADAMLRERLLPENGMDVAQEKS